MTSEYRHPVEADIGIITVMVWKGDAVKEYPPPEGIHFEHRLFKEATDEEVITFVKVFNDAFSEHYNFTPVPAERFLKTRDIEKNVSMMTLAKKGDTIVGISKCGESVECTTDHDMNMGWVDILGVTKSYRKRGIGRALLSDSMKWIHNRGINTIYLEMDAENRDALQLYTSLGFAVDNENIIYQLELNKINMS